MRTILLPERIIDGSGAPSVTGHAVVVENGRIAALMPADAAETRPDDRVLRLDGATLLPGLINNHVHLVLPGDGTPFLPFAELESDASLALWAAHNSRVCLRAGVTAVRDCGGRRRITIDLREAQAAGRAPGARVIACGPPITITGGHTHFFGGQADGVEGVARMVRRVVADGADFVKVMASGGGTPGSLSHFPSFSAAELRALVETAHGLGRKVCAHCIATESISRAVEAGVDFIEHAMMYGPDLLPHYDERVAEQLARSAIPVTPTMQVNRDMVELTPDEAAREPWRIRREVHTEVVGKLHRLGVRLLAGSDAGWRSTSFDSFWKELDELVLAGLTPVAAIHAATGAVAEALGLHDQFGVIRSGLRADLLVVEGDASRDVACLAQVRMVMQNGEVVYPGQEE